MTQPTDPIERAGRFGAEFIEPSAEQWDRAGTVPREFFLEAGRHGLCGLLVPELGGGAELGIEDTAAALAAIARHCFASTFALVVHNNLAAAIARRGTADQVAQFVPPMLAGELVGAFLLTEPEAGSDAAAIQTTATRIPGGWLLDGAKAWISNAASADLLCVYAQTDPAAGARGIASFLVTTEQAGVARTDAYPLLGGHALGTGGIVFDGCEIADDALLVGPGEAFKAAMQGIDTARALVAAMCCGLLERSLSEAIAYVRERPAFGSHVSEFQGVQWMLAEAATDLEAARALALRAAQALDRGANATVACAHAKKFATRAAFTRTADCMQVMGAAGLSREYPLARHLAAAKMAQYLDGASEIQNVVIARDLFAGHR